MLKKEKTNISKKTKVFYISVFVLLQQLAVSGTPRNKINHKLLHLLPR